jgi:hypothetical protein
MINGYYLSQASYDLLSAKTSFPTKEKRKALIYFTNSLFFNLNTNETLAKKKNNL